jgi:DnaB-like helicase C terminal domain/DNA primase catalytic core, N-terminal domain/Toprim-like
MPDVLGYLHAKNLVIKNATNQNIHTSCVFCDEPPDARGRLYINTDPDMDPPGLYMCHRCGASGNLTTLKRHFGDNPTERETDSHLRSEMMIAAATYYHDMLDRFPSVAAYLKGPERGLNADTVKTHLIGYAPMDISWELESDGATVKRSTQLYSHLREAGYGYDDIMASGLCREQDRRPVDSLTGMITLPYHVAGQVVTIRGRSWPYTEADWGTWEFGRYQPPKHKYKTLGGSRARLFNTDATWANKTVALCEGEFDALVLNQAGFPAVGAPGAQSWQDEWDGYFTGMRRIWCIYDRDPAGERGAAKLTERFGAKIRRVHLSPPGVKCDPTTWFQTHTVADFAELLTEASKGGLLVTVHDAIDEFRRVQSQPGLRLRWEQLDGLLAPGLQQGQIMVVLARTNAGKSLFLMNAMHSVRMVDGQADKRMLFLSLEQTRGEWWDRARRIHRFWFPDQTETEAARWWQDHIRLVDRNQLSTVDIVQILDDYEYEVGAPPDLICLDYLGYLARGFKGEAYERTGAAVHALKKLAKDYRIPWIVPQQVSRAAKDGEEFGLDAGRDAGTVEETADFLLGMWRPEDALGKTNAERDGLVDFRILKSRHGGRGACLQMQWSPVTLTYVPLTDPAVARARKECQWHREYPHEPWEETVLRHTPGGLW